MKPIIRLFVLAIGLSTCLPIARSAAFEPRADLTGSKGETVFFLLGMLDEHSGRGFIEDSDMVESFHCGEHVVAFVFRAYLSRLAQEQGLDRAIQVRWRQDCLVCFLSPEVSAFLNQFYSYSFDSGGRARVLTEDGPKRVASASLATSQIKERENELKTAYLAGAHLRYGQGDHFEFADSCDKMTLVADVLRDVGCDSVRVTSRQDISYRVYFHPTDELRGAFEHLPGAWGFESADTLVGLATPEDLSIYREVIRSAQMGDFGGHPLPQSFELRRFTFMPSGGRGRIPGASKGQREALEDYDRACVTLRSVRDLAGDSVRVISDNRRPEAAMISLGRIGFSRSRRTATVIFSYSAGAGLYAYEFAAFLSRQRGQWVVKGCSMH
jgi:hypothetical protein